MRHHVRGGFKFGQRVSFRRGTVESGRSLDVNGMHRAGIRAGSRQSGRH